MIAKPMRVQRREEPIAATITGKDSARAIAAVGCRCQADNQEPRLWITETCDRFGPVILAPVPSRRRLGDFLPPTDESRALVAKHNGEVECE